MANDGARKNANWAKSFTIDPSTLPMKHTFKEVDYLDGTTKKIPAHQVPPFQTMNNRNTWRYMASGQYTNVGQTGGQCNIKLDRQSGSGAVETVRLRLLVTESNAENTTLLPTPLWIQQLQWQTPSGTYCQQLDGSTQWIWDVVDKDIVSWQYAAQYMGSSQQYGTGPPLGASVTQLYYIDLTGNWLEVSKYLNAAVDGDMQLWIYFQPQNLTVTNPSGNDFPTIAQLSLDVEMSQLDSNLLSSEKQEMMKEPTTYVIPWTRSMRFNQSWAAGGQYNLQLSGIKGDVIWCFFMLRKPSNGSYLAGQDFLSMKPIYQFQILNSEGLPITGSTIIDSGWNKNVNFPSWFLGQLNRYQNLYTWNMTDSDQGPLAMIKLGNKMGAYPFSTNEILQVTMLGAGTNEVVTVTNAVSGGSNAAAASGTYQITWNTPYGTATTASLAYNTTAANIAAAIQGLSNFSGTVTASAAASAGSSFTITFGGAYENQPLAVNGFYLSFLGNLATSAPLPITLLAATTTQGVLGMTNNSTMYLDFYAVTSAHIESFKANDVGVDLRTLTS